MASEYTTHRRYPLYTDQDKPNLRDQYNGAIRMIDEDIDDALDASEHVSDALGAGFDAQHTVRMAIDDVDNQLDTIDDKLGTGVTTSSSVTAQLAEKASNTDLNSVKDVLPFSQFSSQNTVNQALDTKAPQAELDALSALLPATQFSAQNTIKAALDAKVSNSELAEKLPVSVKEYGAVGDGVTDDTTAFQAAIDTGNDVYIPVDRGETYLITGQITVSTYRQQIYSAPDSRITESNDSVGILFRAATNDTPCFYVTGHGVRFIGICIHGDAANTRKGIGICTARTAQDVDLYVSNTELWSLKIGIYHQDRGLRCDNVSFVMLDYGIHHISTGMTEGQARAFQVYNCRFHVIYEVCILIEGVLTGAIITGNCTDISNENYFIKSTGSLFACIISSNFTSSIVEFNDFIRSVFSDTTFRIVDAAAVDGKEAFITINGVVENSVISNCVLHQDKNLLRNGIHLKQNRSAYLAMISNIAVYSPVARTGTPYSVVRLSNEQSTANRLGISGITGILNSSPSYVLDSDSAISMGRTFVTVNCSNMEDTHNVTLT